jgi:hypothetical protein
MNPVKATIEILAFKVLNRDINEKWIDWALEMMEAGFHTEHLAILAGEREPFNQFRLQDIATKALAELRLDYSDNEAIIKDYVCYLLDLSLNEEVDLLRILEILKDLYNELDWESSLRDFYFLYWAKEDLLYSETQLYWEGATRGNIDSIIKDYFLNWKKKNQAAN